MTDKYVPMVGKRIAARRRIMNRARLCIRVFMATFATIRNIVYKMKKLQQILLLLTCIAVIATGAIQRDGKIAGHDLRDTADVKNNKMQTDTMRTLDDGTVVINTTALGRDISGYGGPVPLEIHLQQGRVVSVRALKNSETPEFFNMVKPLLKSWNGRTPDEALKMKVDAVSGATFSSRGIIGNMQRGLAYADKKADEQALVSKPDLNAKLIFGLLVALMGAILPLFLKNKRYRSMQLTLNVVVLGFWCGSFLSWSLFVNFRRNGVNIWPSLTLIVMLVVAFIYPLFGKKNYYCTNICPCGSLQDLAAKISRQKWHISQRLVKRLNLVRQWLFIVLMLLMITGISFEWMDYEVFSAFIVTSANVVVLIIGVIVFVLSFFISRPYCRFVCPTGTLFRFTEKRW